MRVEEIKLQNIELDLVEKEIIKHIASISCRGIVCDICPLNNGRSRCLKMVARDVCRNNAITFIKE